MAGDVISTLKSIQDSGVDVASVAAVDILVTLDQADSSYFLSDTTFEWIVGMATVDVVVVEGLDRSGFFGLFFGILNFFTVFRLLDVSFAAIASASSFAFKKKPTKCEQLLFHEQSIIQRVVFIWERSYQVRFPISIKHFLNTYFLHTVWVSKQKIYMHKVKQYLRV